jgi:hypothetical protein
MNNISELLKHGDPIAREPRPGPDDLQRMRRIATTTLPESTPRFWPRPAIVAATVAAAIASSVALGRQLPHPLARASRSGDMARRAEQLETPEPQTRQLQFETPGGTRIIWVFDPNFKL